MKENRKKWLVNPDFQLKFTGFFTMCAFINFLSFIGAVNWYFYKIEEEIAQSGMIASNPIHAFISSHQYSLNLLLVTLTATGTVMMFGIGIWLSNKVAGPIYRVIQDLNAMEPGKDEKDIHFREGDFFLELRDALNSYFKRNREGKKSEDNKDQVA